jgi:hypothetical protein
MAATHATASVFTGWMAKMMAAARGGDR